MPDWNHLVRHRLEPLRLAPGAEADLVEELAQHLADHYRELLSGGASDEDAYRQTLSELDDLYALQAGLERNEKMPKHDAVPVADAGRGSMIEDLWRDLRYALRSMKKSPMFVLFVVITLALGIGANTTVFTIINTLVLNPLPVPRTSELAAVAETDSVSTATARTPIPISYMDLKDFRERNQVFSSLAGYTSARVMTILEHGVSERMFAELVTANYFSTLGLTPTRGRYFLPEEDSTAGTHRVAVLNYGSWQARFGGAPDIIGKTVRINGVELTIVGVGPPSFIGVNAIFGPDLWIPASMAERLLPNELPNALTDRANAIFQGVGRLKTGVEQSAAQANLTTIAATLASEYPATNLNHTAMVRPIRDVLLGSTSSSTAPILFGSVVLLVVVGIVLLIACSNVANLLLARAAARQQEMAVRLAMGASRQRLVRQMLTESVLLGVLSGALGFFVGYAGLEVLFGRLPGAANFVTPKFDGAVFGFALAVSLATGFIFGTIPALRASRGNVAETLKEEARTTGRSRRKITLGNVLLVGQVAFSFVLLVTAALFLRSIHRAYEIDPGVQTAHLAVLMTNPGQAGYGKPQTKAFYKDVEERVVRMQGIQSVSWSSNLPLWSRPANGLLIEGRQERSKNDSLRTIVNTVSPSYFDTSGMAIRQGRAFTNMDIETSPLVAIVNEKMAHDYWPDGALGKRLQLPGEKQMRQVVGLVRNANYTLLGEVPQLAVYVPLEQHYSDGMILNVRTRGNPAEMILPVEHEIRAAGPQVLVSSPRTGAEIVDGGLFQAKMGVAMLTIFGALALGLASIGLYGILAYSVNQRKREFGLRMALGASPGSVLGLILKQGMSLVMTGVLIGLVVSLLVGPLLSTMLYGVSAADLASVVAAAFILSLVALLACYLPARWATRVDPLTALRET